MNPNTQEIHGSDSKNIKTLKCNTANGSNDILLDGPFDPDLNFFCKNIKNLDTMYVSQEDFLEKSVTGYFSILHLNIPSIKKKLKVSKSSCPL